MEDLDWFLEKKMPPHLLQNKIPNTGLTLSQESHDGDVELEMQIPTASTAINKHNVNPGGASRMFRRDGW